MPGENILIVDDNPTNLKLIKVLLSIEGYHLQTATNATEALTILKTFRPQLILMDLQLPGMDGLELTRIIKTDETLANPIIVAVTAYAMKGDEQKAINAGCDGYIAKPIDTKTLPEIITHLLKEKNKK